MSLYELLMTDHEEEILQHLTQLDYDNADVAKAYQFLPINQAVHKLDEENIETPVYVPAMFADVIVAMSTETTADDSLAQLKDATAWVPKQMRLMYKKTKEYFKAQNPEPDWVKEIKDKHAKEEEALETLGGSPDMADAIRRMSGRKPAPGDPGGLDASKPIQPPKPKKFDPKKRGLDQLPPKWVDDPANFDDGKTNKTRLVGTFARFPTNSAGRSKYQLHRWCICEQSSLTEQQG